MKSKPGTVEKSDRVVYSMVDQKMHGALTRCDSAVFLSISTRKLDSLISEGLLKKIKIGTKTVIAVEELIRFLKASEVKNKEPHSSKCDGVMDDSSVISPSQMSSTQVRQQ